MAWIKEVRLENFMSYDYARIPVRDGVNLVVGPNGSGKSSILLAISLAFGQIYTERSKKLSDLIKWGKDSARVSLIIDNSRKNGKRTFAFSNSDSVMVSRYIKRDGSYWYEVDYREASLYEVQSIFRRIGINPSNMLIIMHQNTLERFSALKPEEKLSLLEDAVGFGGYRNRIIESSRKLSDIERAMKEMEEGYANAEQSLAYWKKAYDSLMQRRELEKALSYLNLELSWSRVLREEKALRKLEEEKAGKEKEILELGKSIAEGENNADEHRKALTSKKSIDEDLLEAYVRMRIGVAIDVFRRDMLVRDVSELDESIRKSTEYIGSITPQGGRIETERSIKEIEDSISETKEGIAKLGDIPENAEEVYRSFADEFYVVEERRKEIEENRKVVEKELSERRKVWKDKMGELIKSIEPEYRGVLREIEGEGYIRITGEIGRIEECGLEIYVGFKGNEPRLLDPMTQSGGERAAATMAFLLAIQQSIKSKFRAVDEFDVHMDLRNRERIYNTIMKSVRDDEQYLIITPNQISVKNEGMNVIVVQRNAEASKPAVRAR